MEILVEFMLISHSFPTQDVYKEIGLEGQIENFEKRYQTISGEDYWREEHCSITYSTGYIKTIDTRDSIEKIFTLLHPRERQIVQCIQRFHLKSKFCIVINLTDNPIIILPKNFIDMASRFKSEIEFDTYLNYSQNDKVI